MICPQAKQIYDLLSTSLAPLIFDCMILPYPCVVECCIHCNWYKLCHIFYTKHKVLIKAANFCFMNECNHIKNYIVKMDCWLSAAFVVLQKKFRFTSTQVRRKSLEGSLRAYGFSVRTEKLKNLQWISAVLLWLAQSWMKEELATWFFRLAWRRSLINWHWNVDKPSSWVMAQFIPAITQ